MYRRVLSVVRYIIFTFGLKYETGTAETTKEKGEIKMRKRIFESLKITLI